MGVSCIYKIALQAKLTGTDPQKRMFPASIQRDPRERGSFIDTSKVAVDDGVHAGDWRNVRTKLDGKRKDQINGCPSQNTSRMPAKPGKFSFLDKPGHGDNCNK